MLGWLAWAVTSIYLAPAIEEGGYAAALLNMGTLAAGVLALVLAVEALIRKGAEEGKLALRLGLLLFLSAVLYFLPFVLWLMNLLPVYTLALGFGAVLGGGLLAANIKKVR